MEFWEFLIQKEGDRSWLPLESPDVEILEGRYRVVARSNRVNTSVEIRISHIATTEAPPKRRTQIRSSRTNQDGLIVIIPFTRLQAGIWELRCVGDLMADFLGDGWQYAVKLQVVSHETASAEEWEPDWDQGAETTSMANGKPLSDTTDGIPDPQTSPMAIAATPPLATIPESSESAEPVPMVSIAPEVDLVEQAPPAIAAVNPSDSAIAASAIASHLFQEAEQMSEQVVASIFEEIDQAMGQSWEDDSIDLLMDNGTDLSERILNPMASETDEGMFAVDGDLAVEDGIRAVDEGLAVDHNETAELQVQSQLEDNEMLAIDDGIADLQVQLQLERETYTARQGQSLVLAGYVEALNEALNADSASVSIPATTLQIRLQDPQTAQVLVDVNHSLSASPLPLPFDCAIAIPSGYQTRLLLGTVTLIVMDATGRVIRTLATQPFTVAAELNDLLEAIANSFSDSDTVPPPLEFANSSSANLDLTFLKFLAAPQPFLHLQPSGQQILPPQLQPSDATTAKSKPLDLPRFSSVASTVGTMPEVARGDDAIAPAQAVILQDPPESPAVTQTVDQAIVNQVTMDQAKEPLPSLVDILHDDAVVSSHTWTVQHPAIESHQPPDSVMIAEHAASPEDLAFQSLNLQHRFWSRLNALVADTELSQGLWVEPLLTGDAPLGLDTDLAAQEVVVDEERGDASRQQPDPLESSPKMVLELPKSMVLPDDEPVLTPQLEVPSGELTAGTSIVVTVKLPDVTPRIYVKLWIHDRQTRTLLDEPRWLVAFVPDGLGHLETRIQLAVPYGCLDVQFEAIAVEMATQRESHKVTVDRKIIPPDLPMLSLDELDV